MESRIVLGDFDDERVKALLRHHLADMHAHSPACHVHALDWAALQRPEIQFYTLWEGDALLGCGALKDLGDGTGELKSMRTAEGHKRKGVAQRLLAHLLDEARRRGHSRVSLETGRGPAFEPAIALYLKHGFTEGPPFAGYGPSDFSRYFHRSL